ncbi:MAG: hypothetical protein AB7F88_04705 [Pyrinomonadaceae bacterium]
MRKVISILQIILLGLTAIACGSSPNANTNSTSNANKAARVCDPTSDSPIEAYKRLYAAVKEKNTDKIKAEMSGISQEFAESLAGRQNKEIAEVYANGFTATTFAPNLPQIRDPRTTNCWAAVEVWNSTDSRWEDLPFVNEGGSWKLAIGEMFSGEYQSPGKGMDQLEKEAANTSVGNVPMAPNPIANVNADQSNSNTRLPPAPKYDGPQVEPLPKKK